MSDVTDATLRNAARRIAVHDVMHRYALAIDTKDWALLETVFAPEITADFRSFGAKAVYSGPGQGWVEQVRSTIDGMEATQHLMANHLYEVAGGRAVGTTYIQALHRCKSDWGGDTYTIGGHYSVEMMRTDDGWRIEHYTLHCTWHDGDRHVLKTASRRAANARK